MRKCPKIGDRVRYKGSLAVGPCVGAVTKIYIQYTWDNDKSDSWNALHGAPLAEFEWHVAMRPDVLPERWAYKGNDTFAPQVADLAKI